jgi:hypothetical protein
VPVQGRCGILAPNGPAQRRIDSHACTCGLSPSRLSRAGTPVAAMPCSLRPWLRRVAMQVITLQATILERFTPQFGSTNLLLLPPLSFRSSALPSASAIAVCARSAAEASLLQACLACPEGGHCAGKLSPPIAKQDWWGIDGGTLFTSCQTGRCLGSTNCSQVSTRARTGQDGQTGADSIVEWPCRAVRTRSHPELSGVVQLYTGRLCKRCNRGYYPWFGECLQCPDDFAWTAKNTLTVICQYGIIWLLWIVVNRLLCETLMMADSLLNFAQMYVASLCVVCCHMISALHAAWFLQRWCNRGVRPQLAS